MGLTRLCHDAAASPARIAQARALALQLGLRVEALAERRLLLPARYQCGTGAASSETAAETVVLWLDDAGLGLQAIEKPLPAPVRVDFASDALRWRMAQGGGGGEAVVKACGIKPVAAGTPRLRVLDATAGWGRDSWLLAHVGADVQSCERSPVVQALLRDGLARAAATVQTAETAARIQLHEGSAQDVLLKLRELPAAERPETVYLDPMFPHRDKSALVKLDMRLFRQVVGSDDDADELLALARQVATRRIVVKRPRHAPDLAGVAPHQRMEGQSNRFDLYAPVVG
ncbi:MAG: class I SAM-dependent methyltransferase [Pseudomonadota bacterium]